jgi:CO/xanthine dehydrogenase Mo-binding subunit
VVLALALEHAGGPYRVPHAWLKAACVYTNNPVSGAFRGFGVPQVAVAMEQMMDLLAGRVGTDPLAIRRKNAIHQGETSPIGATVVSSTGIVHCLDTLNAHSAWQRRHAWKIAAGPFTRRGVGMAALVHGCGYGPVVPDYANAKVELTEEGGIRVYCGVVDMGQGNASTNAQIAGSILGQPVDDIELVLPDTERTLPSGSASASRCTFTFANALIGAAQALKARIVDRGADLLFAEHPDDVVLIAGHVRHLRTGRQIPLSTIARFFNASERVAIHRFKAPTARDDLGVPDNLRLHGLPHRVFSYAAHCAWVEVDELTGEVHVSHYLAITDSGKIINPQIYEQQIQGGIAQGMGWALYEDFQVQEGTVQTVDFATYTIPTAMDVPDVESIPVELYEPTGPYGLKGVGEIATNGPAPAIANAIADAIGVRITHFPFTPERVLQAVLSVTNKGTGA